MENIKRQSSIMSIKKLSPREKKILFQKVHCTKYLKPCQNQFRLQKTDKSTSWYALKTGNKSEIVGRLSFYLENVNSYFCNRRFEIKEKSFAGVVVKISEENFSTWLGIIEDIIGDPLPHKHDGVRILVATVYFQNGKKRLVPLSCIQEYEKFDDGKELCLINSNMEKYSGRIPCANRIIINGSLRENSSEMEQNSASSSEQKFSDSVDSLEIENSYYAISEDGLELSVLKRTLKFDIAKRNVEFSGELGRGWFFISDEEYNQVLGILKNQIKNECGFEPMASYGITNFEKLVNFGSFPFSPELNCFSEFFYRLRPDDSRNFSGTELFSSESLADELQHSPDCVQKFIEYCGFKYSPKMNKIFLLGHLHFAEYLGIVKCGLTDENVIKKIMLCDKANYFATAVLYGGAVLCDMNNEAKFVFLSEKRDGVINYTKFLMEVFRNDNEKTARLIIGFVDETSPYGKDVILYMKTLNEENHLTEEMLKKLGKEGPTEYNHNMLMQAVNDLHPEYLQNDDESDYVNQKIEYTNEEKILECEISGYSFCLPEDTNRLMQIGSEMNICVGHLYSDAAVNKEATIVYAKKDEKCVLCIEINKNAFGQFVIVQKSAFNNQKPKGKDLEAIKRWCFEKAIKNAS